ncbi:MAG: hypothetical protein CBD27_02240 [Rhodospirillaceae bacterium TMED167]|nr:hypothetical protein [Rhodospirillaceae bacterium]OUW30024.1 MAG: hypothetical protein CBD27_02240 [Rhodospirillaceae bacterium TMED167]
MPTEPLTLYTSLVPGTRLDMQRAAIQSWNHAGFQVTTLNSHHEAAAVAEVFPEVACETVLRDGKLATGKPVIFINDILQHIRDKGSDKVGIINSDILLTPTSSVAELVAKLPEDTLLTCPRTDVDQPDQINGLLDPYGYDAFFFNRSLIRDWNETSFNLGMPFWDHWFPMMSLLSGRRVLKLISDEFRHLRHHVAWENSLFMFNSHFAELMISQMLDNNIGFGDEFDYSSYASLSAAALSEKNSVSSTSQATPELQDLARFFDSLTKYVIHFIHARSEKIQIQKD